MGKGGKSHGDVAEVKDAAEEENIAAWLVSINSIKILPFKLPALGNSSYPKKLTRYGSDNKQRSPLYVYTYNPWIRGVAKFHELPIYVIKSNIMAQVVKAVHMILEMGANVPAAKKGMKTSFDMEIEDDAPKRNPSLEEIDALERMFGMPTLEKNVDDDYIKLASAVYLQVSTISQALIFVTRSRSWSFVERPGMLLVVALQAIHVEY